MQRAGRPCRQPGCEQLQPCSQHRPGSNRAGSPYDEQWRRFAAAWLRRYPRCNRCRQKAVVAHHRIPLRLGGARLDPANIESLCVYHHRLAHRAERSDLPDWVEKRRDR